MGKKFWKRGGRSRKKNETKPNLVDSLKTDTSNREKQNGGNQQEISTESARAKLVIHDSKNIFGEQGATASHIPAGCANGSFEDSEVTDDVGQETAENSASTLIRGAAQRRTGDSAYESMRGKGQQNINSSLAKIAPDDSETDEEQHHVLEALTLVSDLKEVLAAAKQQLVSNEECRSKALLEELQKCRQELEEMSKERLRDKIRIAKLDEQNRSFREQQKSTKDEQIREYKRKIQELELQHLESISTVSNFSLDKHGATNSPSDEHDKKTITSLQRPKSEQLSHGSFSDVDGSVSVSSHLHLNNPYDYQPPQQQSTIIKEEDLSYDITAEGQQLWKV